MNSHAPIRSRAAEEGSFQIPLWGVPFVLLLLYVCLFNGLGSIGLVGPDEPRYAAIARAMSETHDWITPRLWGAPWFEKPVLYYWAAGVAMRLFGVSEFAARLPSALAALLAVVAVAWTALRSYGLGVAWYSLLMLPTSVAMIGFARAASPDMLFAGFLTAAMAIAVEMLQKEKPGAILRIAFGFFLGAAVLAKGPAAVILAGGATLLWAALTRQWTASFSFLHPLVIAAFCVTALPWYVLCALRNPDFLRVFLWQHNFERYTTPIFEHRQPFWFFGAVFLAAILPWLPILFASIPNAAALLQWKNSPALFLACWAIFTVLFFSLSQSKLPGYILPAIPPAILLLCVSMGKPTQLKSRSLSRAISSVGIIVPAGVGIALAVWNWSSGIDAILHADLVKSLPIAFSVAIVCGAAVIAFSTRRQLNNAVCVAACMVAILIIVASRIILPGFDARFSARPAGSWAIGMHDLGPSEVAVFELPRAYRYGLNYYFNADLAEWTPQNTSAKILFCGRDALQSPQLIHISGPDTTPATDDGKVFLVILQHPPESKK